MSDTDPYGAPSAPVVQEARVFNVEKPAPVVEEVAPEAAEPVPEGPAKVVLSLVGTDKVRAAQALAAEKEGQKRTTLMTKLEDIIKE